MSRDALRSMANQLLSRWHVEILEKPNYARGAGVYVCIHDGTHEASMEIDDQNSCTEAYKRLVYLEQKALAW